MKKVIIYISILTMMFFVGCNENSSINDIIETTNEKLACEDEIEPKDTEKIISSHPNEETKTVEHIIEKPEYSLDLTNYDIDNKLEKYLLWIELDPIWAESKNLHVGDYFIDVQETNILNTYYEITSNSLIPEALKVDSGMVRKFSEDGQKVFLSYWIKEEKTNVIEVFDFVNNEVLYHYESKETFKVSSNSNFNHLIVHNYESDHDYFIDISREDKGMVKIPKYPLNTVMYALGKSRAFVNDHLNFQE